ncbi:uncharacterized protein DSM5745_07552 [Aspergillus mulundensis]|uniref:Uncharacterized protein n=1 Tax=Aspergillus mulundensis TaxID=1810919 RepID=A0A3D8REH1_9EURO|nr:Uncharacterized protein DSM5745_07552 [Aspergillus mulundensis]RDW72380.1 Uncharacterized protein DSM5745_07552 [Aspergillus mulundensis]
MAGQRFIIRSEGYAQAVPAFARRAVDYEIDYEFADDQRLASSQPVSLIQLCRKSSSRNRATRKAKVFLSESASDLAEAGFPITREVDKHQHFPRLSLPSYSASAEYGPGDDPETLTLPSSRFVSQDYPWQREESHSEAVQEQTWHSNQSEYHPQENPLNYANQYNRSHSGETSYVTESPFLRKSDYNSAGRGTGPVDSTPVTIRSPLDTPQSYLYSQRTQQKEHLPTALQIYRDSFDRPNDRSPYESYRLNRRNNRTDLPEITSGLQFGDSSDLEFRKAVGNTTVRSEPGFATHSRSRLSNTEVATQSSVPRKAHKSHDALVLRPRLSSGTSTSQRTLKEEIYAILDSMHVDSQTDFEPTPTQTPGGTESSTSASEMNQALPAEPTAMHSLWTGGETETKQAETTTRVHISSKEAQRHEQADADTSPPGLSQSNIEPLLESQEASVAPLRITKLPPGLPRPEIISSGKLTAFTNERLPDASLWFHTDNRGQDQLRRHISDIAEKFLDRTERLGGQNFPREDRTVTEQTIALLGGVIANLQSYSSDASNAEERRGGYFGNFAPVASRYCDLPVRGRRSYFEDPWESLMEGVVRDGEFS